MRFTSLAKVRFSEVDRAGIVYFPRFLNYFHVAFEDFFDQYLGTPYADVITQEGFAFPAVRTEVDFKKPLRFGELMEIEVAIEEIGRKSCRFRYTLRVKGDEEVRAVGRVTSVAVEMAGFTSIPIPDKYRRLFEAYLAQQGE
ncbi:MAG: acyl-CoA thioesterase [Deltaproteobacteria bacterium]|nr:acyl-CoA thioesterase [Deltaproteobacteria bacterium]